ncbi:MAG: ATP synthase F1 subunit delta [Phycisphaerae bacterium]
MSTTDTSVMAIADSYAQALLGLTEQQGVSDEVLEQLAALKTSLETDAGLADFMASAAIDEDARAKTLERACRGKMSDVLLDTLLVMNSKGRSSIVPVFCDRYRLAVELHRRQVEVQVTSATPLNKKQRASLSEVLQKITGQQPVLIETVDASVLGGLVVQVGDEKLDCSVAGRLNALRRALADRASRELHAGKQYVEAN